MFGVRPLPVAFTLLAATLPCQDWWPAPVTEALTQAGDKADTWQAMLRDVPEAHRKGMAFLIENMPERDLRDLDPQWIRDDVALAYEAWKGAPWAAQISEDLFFDAILPYAHVSEPRAPWRAMMRDRFLESVKDCKTPTEAVQVLNRTVFPTLKVKYSRQRKRADQNLQESMEIGMASCTGLSVILADACRAVGVPARLAGIANWPNKRGNHTWVEVWDGEWHFTGAAEPAAELNQTWFENDAALATPGSRRTGVWAATWRRTGDWFPMVWAPDVKRLPPVTGTWAPGDHAGRAAAALQAVEHMGDYLLLSHPTWDDDEMRGFFRANMPPGAVGRDRDGQRKVFVDDRVLGAARSAGFLPTRYDEL